MWILTGGGGVIFLGGFLEPELPLHLWEKNSRGTGGRKIKECCS